MKFKIVSKKSDGSFLTHYFDNITLDITTDEGIPVVLKNDPRCVNLVSEFEPTIDGVKNKEEITSLRITLGFNCNFHCKYCIEQKYDAKKVIPIKENIDQRAERIVDRILNTFPNVNHLVFWGGEPLVYFKLMKKIVELLKERKPKIKLSTITNGSLLTLDIAKWLVEHNINLTISHDGPSFNVYRNDKDPLDNPQSLEAIRYYFNAMKDTEEIRGSFNIVVTPENADLQKIVPFFVEKLGFTPRINFESIAKLDKNTAKVITPFDEKISKLMLNNLVAYASTEDNKHDYGALRDDTTSVLKRLVSKYIPDMGCMIKWKKFAAVDMNGRVLLCHGNPKNYCDLEEIDKVNFPKVYSWRERESCATCPFVVSCLGGCPMIETEEDHLEECKNLKIWHAGFFIAAWKLLFEAMITRIEPVLEE